MSNEVTIFKDNRVTVSGPRESALTGVFEQGRLTTRRIQANINGTFRRIVNGEQIGSAVKGEVDVVIINALPKPSRIFYKDKYDPAKEATLPNCWSNDGDTPEDGVPDPQGFDCNSCPQNIKGSGENGSRACRFQRRLAVLVVGDDAGDVYQMNIPAKSLFGKGTGNEHPFESYVRYVTANNEALDNIVTRVSFNSESTTMELIFSAQRHITDEEYELVKAARAKPEFGMYIRLTAAQTDKVEKLPEKTEAAATDDGDDGEEVLEEPKKVSKSKPQMKPAKPENIADSISDWD